MSFNLSDSASLLDRREQGEAYLNLTFFAKSLGLVRAKARIASKGKRNSVPDLFNVTELHLKATSPDRPLYLEDWHDLQSFPELGLDYQRLTVASRIANLFKLNLLHLEDFETPWQIYTQSIEAVARKPHPAISYLKAAYLFARSEGYPVKSSWLVNLPSGLRRKASQYLSASLLEINGTVDVTDADAIILSLHQFFHRECDLVPPD